MLLQPPFATSESNLIIISILAGIVPCLNRTLCKSQQKSPSSLWVCCVLSLLLSGICTTSVIVYVQICYYSAETPLLAHHAATTALFVGSIGCAFQQTIDLGLECWNYPPEHRRDGMKWWGFPIVVLGLAFAPLILAWSVWQYWLVDDEDVDPGGEEMFDARANEKC